MHARLVVGDKVLMGSDAPPDHFEKPQGIRVSIQIDDPNEAERIFAALADNGTVRMPHPADVLGHPVRHADRQVRHPLDGELRTEAAQASVSEWVGSDDQSLLTGTRRHGEGP